MIIFVGDKPSKSNLDPNIAFVGTKSYKTLLGWIADMDINIADVLLTNNITTQNNTWFSLDNHVSYRLTPNLTKFVALGKAAEEKLEKLKLHYFSLPHPSGLNRKINDKQWLDIQLKACKQWLK